MSPPNQIFESPRVLPAQPNWTWTTVDGKHTYRKVVVCKVEADCVTILDEDGGARIDMVDLPPEIQERLDYNPDLASQAAVERQQQEQANQQALTAEQQKAKDIAKSEMVATDKNDSAILADAARKQAAIDAQGRVAQAQIDMAVAQDDLDVSSRYVTVDSRTGQLVGNAY